MSAVDRQWAERVGQVAYHLAQLLDQDPHITRHGPAVAADLHDLRSFVLTADTYVAYTTREHAGDMA
jgi:hypothetical protein